MFHGWRKINRRILWGRLKERDHLEEQVVDGYTYLLTYILTYLLTPWSIVLLEKLTGFQLIKKFPKFYRTRMFIPSFTSARHLSLSWATFIYSIPPHSITGRSILILFSHLRLGLPSGFFPSDFRTKTLYTPLLSPPYALHAPPKSFFSILSPEKYRVSSTDH